MPYVTSDSALQNVNLYMQLHRTQLTKNTQCYPTECQVCPPHRPVFEKGCACVWWGGVGCDGVTGHVVEQKARKCEGTIQAKASEDRREAPPKGAPLCPQPWAAIMHPCPLPCGNIFAGTMRYHSREIHENTVNSCPFPSSAKSFIDFLESSCFITNSTNKCWVSPLCQALCSVLGIWDDYRVPTSGHSLLIVGKDKPWLVVFSG